MVLNFLTTIMISFLLNFGIIALQQLAKQIFYISYVMLQYYLSFILSQIRGPFFYVIGTGAGMYRLVLGIKPWTHQQVVKRSTTELTAPIKGNDSFKCSSKGITYAINEIIESAWPPMNSSSRIKNRLLNSGFFFFLFSISVFQKQKLAQPSHSA